MDLFEICKIVDGYRPVLFCFSDKLHKIKRVQLSALNCTRIIIISFSFHSVKKSVWTASCPDSTASARRLWHHAYKGIRLPDRKRNPAVRRPSPASG